MQILITIREIFSTPELLVGFVVFIGLFLQKKPIDQIIKGTGTAIVGFVLLSEGSNFLQNGALKDFGVLFNYDFHIRGVVPNMEAVASLGIAKYTTEVSMIMFFGMIANIVMARFGPFPYIFLTGHHTLYMACLLTIVLHLSRMSGWQLILGGSLMLGLLMSAMPALIEKETKKVTGGDRIALGHFSTVSYLIAAKVAHFCTRNDSRKKDGRAKTSTEDIRFPAHLSFMKDTTIEIFLVMTVVFLILTAIASGRSDFSSLNISYKSGQNHNWFVYAFIQGASFSAAIYIILTGVRLVIGEIVPAFKGIAKKIVPHAKPAVDCPILFSYAPNAVMIGFFMSFLGGTVVMIVLLGINAWRGNQFLPVIVPGVVAHFFCGGSAGVFSNVEGGIKGCLIGSFVHGIVISLLSLAMIPVLGVFHMSGTSFSDADFCVVGIIFGNLAIYYKKEAMLMLCITCFILPIILENIKEK